MSRTGIPCFDKKPRVWTEEIIERLEMLYCVMGWDIDAIAKELGSTPAAVGNQRKLLGLRFTPQAVQSRRARGIASRRWLTPLDKDYSRKMSR